MTDQPFRPFETHLDVAAALRVPEPRVQAVAAEGKA